MNSVLDLAFENGVRKSDSLCVQLRTAAGKPAPSQAVASHRTPRQTEHLLQPLFWYFLKTIGFEGNTFASCNPLLYELRTHTWTSTHKILSQFIPGG